MASHGYTYVPSKDLNPNVRVRDEQIRQMSFAEVKEYVRALHEEMNVTAAKFQRLCTYNEMIQSGLYWQDFVGRKRMQAASIRKISNVNLCRCAREVEGIHLKFKHLIDRLESFDWVLKHNTKPKHINTILTDRIILSLTEIQRLGLGDKLKGGTEKGGRDHTNIHNEDFVFFRLAFGDGPAHSRFGSECLVFTANQLFKTGWISLFDMLKPDSTDRIAVLHSLDFTQNKVAPQKKNPFAVPVRSVHSDQMDLYMRYQKAPAAEVGAPVRRPPLSGLQKLRGGGMQRQSGRMPAMSGGVPQVETRTLHRAEIVFFGPDIRRGIAYSVVTELNLIGGAGMLERAMAAEDPVLAQIVSNLFWIEAKIPRFFQFSEEGELLARHSGVVYTKNTFE